MADYLLGLDAGNTVIKAVIFDLEGNEIAAAAQEGHSRVPRPGHVERGLEELWTHARAVIRQCVERAGIRAEEIVAIGCAGHGNGLYALDQGGEPLLGIQSLDTRAAGLVEEWKAQGVGDRTYADRPATALAVANADLACLAQALSSPRPMPGSARCFCARISSSTA